MEISLEVASAVSVLVEMMLYGIYTCLFFEAVYIMLRRRSDRNFTRSAKIFLGYLVLMYLVATTHISWLFLPQFFALLILAVISVFRLLKAFVLRVEPMGPIFYLLDSRRWENISSGVMLCIMIWLGDSLVIYRCYMIWNHNIYVVVLPILLLIASLIVNSVMFCWIDHPNLHGPPPARKFMPLANAIYPIAFVQNVLTTGMIALKIWNQHCASSAVGVANSSSSLSLINIMRIIVESAMIYTLQLLVLIILYPIGSFAQLIMQGAIVPSIGIAFVLISVRVHMNKSSTLFKNSSTSVRLPSWVDETNGQSSIPESIGHIQKPDDLQTDDISLQVKTTRPSLSLSGPINESSSSSY